MDETKERTAPASAQASGDDDVLLRVEHLTKSFVAKSSLFGKPLSFVSAVDDVSFTIRRGEVFGLVGESGCGKTTVGRMIAGLIAPTSGTIIFDGKDITALGKRERRELTRDIQLIFQDPYASLDPRMNVGEIIAEPIVAHKLLPEEEIPDRVSELLELVGLSPSMATRYPHEFSGGQRQRIGIARALAPNPKLVICDEAVSALDVSVQAQVLNLLESSKERLGFAYLFIAHGLNVVKHVSDRVGVMYLGKLMEVAEGNELYHYPLCPYTQALLSAIPSVNPAVRRKRIILEGDVPSPIDPAPGCRFASRCYAKVGACEVTFPELRSIGGDVHHEVACHRYDGIDSVDKARTLAEELQTGMARAPYGRGENETNSTPAAAIPKVESAA